MSRSCCLQGCLGASSPTTHMTEESRIQRCLSVELEAKPLHAICARGPVKMDELLAKFYSHVGRDSNADAMIETSTRCADLLAHGAGGMMLGIVHEHVLKAQLDFDTLDDGAHTECFRNVCRDVKKPPFKTMFELLTAHNHTDRWEPQEVQALENKIPDARKYSDKLLKQPKDGAIVVSHWGSVKGAAMHVKYSSTKLQFVKSDGTAAGTRHASALGFAEHLCGYFKSNLCPGVILTRSDAGGPTGGHAFFPQPDGLPIVYCFETLSTPSQIEKPSISPSKSFRPFSQIDILSKLKEHIKKHGQRVIDIVPKLAREGVIGETVVSLVDGQITSQREIDCESMVLKANTPDQELYALKKTSFNDLYLTETDIDMSEVDDLEGVSQPLKKFTQRMFHSAASRGFKLYMPNPNNWRWIYKVTDQDVNDKLNSANCFEAPWDPSVLQPLWPGTWLGMGNRDNEIYWMPPNPVEDGPYAPLD